MPNKAPGVVENLGIGAGGIDVIQTRTDISNPIPKAVYTLNGVSPTAVQGADIACSNGTSYYSEIYIPYNMTVTGLGYLIGSVGGTNKAVLSLHDGAGKLIANTDPAGVTVGTAANFQKIALTSTKAIIGPGRYYVAATFNGTTAKFRAYTIPNTPGRAGSSTATFGTPVDLVISATDFTADKGPIMFVY